MESDTPKADDRWTVRGIPETVREEARNAARRADLTVAEWLIRAIRAYVAAEYAELNGAAEVFPPDRRVSDAVSDRPSLDDIARALQLAQMISRMRRRRNVSRAVLRLATARLEGYLSEAPAPASDEAADQPPSSRSGPLLIRADSPDSASTPHPHADAP